MADITAGKVGFGVAFMVAAGLVYEIIAAMCSSPQTAEINAVKRSQTLMKWVNIGVVNAALFIIVAAAIDKPRSKAILSGGAVAIAIMYVAYFYANKAGLKNGEPGTEN
ncbi:MAG: hypothetical protein ACREHG_05970 [Candidatus Saccharimonadales bacterium]